MINQRLQRGQEIAKANQIRRIDSNTYVVKSQSSNYEYEILQPN
jgi:hypothetical protein